MNLDDAIRYVGGGTRTEYELSCRLQFELLQGTGLQPHHTMLEIGGGVLGLASLVTTTLNPGNLVVIEPRGSLTRAGFAEFPFPWRPQVLHREDFDPSESGMTFDRVFSHSVLTHASKDQPAQFLRAVRPHLKPGAVILASARIGPDTNNPTWTYPWAVYFSLATLEKIAADEGFSVAHRPELRERCEAALPRMFHDWLQFAVASG